MVSNTWKMDEKPLNIALFSRSTSQHVIFLVYSEPFKLSFKTKFRY